MAERVFDDDLADLLGDNSSSNNQTKSRRGDFLGALKRNKISTFPTDDKESTNDAAVRRDVTSMV